MDRTNCMANQRKNYKNNKEPIIFVDLADITWKHHHSKENFVVFLALSLLVFSALTWRIILPITLSQ